MIEFILNKIVDDSKVVTLMTKNHGNWADYLFRHGNEYSVYNTYFTSNLVEAIVIFRENIVIQLKN